jgi:hypothetical protein
MFMQAYMPARNCICKDYVSGLDTVTVKVFNILCVFSQWVPLGKNVCDRSDFLFIHFRPPCAGHKPAQNS